MTPSKNPLHLDLTEELCALVPPQLSDPGPHPDLRYYTADEHRAAVEATLDRLGNRDEVWLFAYGSLIWKPVGTIVETRKGTLEGYRRSFCLRSTRWRGSPERPGLVLGLVPGGETVGFVQRLSPLTAPTDLLALYQRELTVNPPNQLPEIVPVQTSQGEVTAVVFVSSPDGPSFVRDMSREQQVDMLATGSGNWGSSAEYLRQVVKSLLETGINDEYLMDLQRSVAALLRSRFLNR